MIIDQNPNVVMSNVPSNGAQYTIAATGHAFQILSSAIYEHKIAAVVRELCTNAFDSHVQAGKADIPFSVNLPNEIFPYFEVEDYGVGMSMEDAVNVYTVYFASTKNTSNDVAGGLGIGSKTPFAYTRQFTVRIRKDGIENTALVYMDSAGCPRMDVISTIKTEEPNGVKVTVPVDPSDIHRFEDEAKFFLSFYKVMPTLNRHIDICYPGVGASLEESSVVYCKKAGRSNSLLSRGDFYVVMGPVPYAVDVYNMLSDAALKNMLRSIRVSSDASMFIRVNIGDVSVAASRETLSMDERTEKFVSALFENEFKKYHAGIIADATDASAHPIDAFVAFLEKYPSSSLQRIGFGCENSHIAKARKALTIPKLYSVRETWRRRSLDFKKVYPSMVDVRNHAIHNGAVTIFMLDKRTGDHPRNAVIRSQTFDYVYDGTMSTMRKERLERLFGTKIKLISYESVYKELVEARKAARGNAPVVRSKYEKTNIPTSGFRTLTVDGKPTRAEYFTGRIDLDDSCFYYDDSILDISSSDYSAIESILLWIAKTTKKNISLVKKVKQNAIRIEKYGVPSVANLFNEIAKNNKDALIASFVKSIFNANMAGSPHYRLLVDAGSKYLDEDIVKEYEFFYGISKNTDLDIPCMTLAKFRYLFASLYAEALDVYNKIAELNIRVKRCCDIMEEHYPIVFHHICYDFQEEDTDTRHRIIHVMKAIDEFNDMLYSEKSQKESE